MAGMGRTSVVQVPCFSGGRMTFYLQWPPSINHYWRRVGNKTILSKEGRDYRTKVANDVRFAGFIASRLMPGRLSVEIVAYTPDRRRRDLDNLLKAILDCLQHAGVYKDDSQVDRLLIERGPVGEFVLAAGGIRVRISPLSETMKA